MPSAPSNSVIADTLAIFGRQHLNPHLSQQVGRVMPQWLVRDIPAPEQLGQKPTALKRQVVQDYRRAVHELPFRHLL
jgi:hypothetical protein